VPSRSRIHARAHTESGTSTVRERERERESERVAHSHVYSRLAAAAEGDFIIRGSCGSNYVCTLTHRHRRSAKA
jgi:hypothetical protein